ncbi:MULTISPECIES: hypothetical protein [Olivibacter]|uniref:Uncharacterized protein n=1 Tax=Olivibacter jilunii TaxID=985016 RepID=A0ABW6AYP3_9SPHI
MITIDRTFNISKEAIDIALKYPKRAHRKVDAITATTDHQINNFINKKVKAFLLETLSKYVKQRQFILTHFAPDDKSKYTQLYELDRIMREVDRLQSARVVVVMAAIYWMEGALKTTSPLPNSKYYKHYEELILPMIEFCRVYSFEHRRKART